MNVKYHYLIMSQKDMSQNQVLEEILRERTNYYFAKERSFDFWILPCPNFIKELNLDSSIKKTNFYLQKKDEINSFTQQNFYMSLVTLDKKFLNWIQLRLGYFENISQDIISKTKYKSDGVYGFFESNDLNNSLSFDESIINPDIILKRYKTVLSLKYGGN